MWSAFFLLLNVEMKKTVLISDKCDCKQEVDL